MNYSVIIRTAIYIGTFIMVLLAAKVIFDGNQWRSVWGQYYMFYSALALALSIGCMLGFVILKGKELRTANQLSVIGVLLFIANLSALLLTPFFTAIVLCAGFIFCFIFQFRTDIAEFMPSWYRSLALRALPFAIGANMAIAITWFD